MIGRRSPINQDPLSPNTDRLIFVASPKRSMVAIFGAILFLKCLGISVPPGIIGSFPDNMCIMTRNLAIAEVYLNLAFC